MRCVSLVTPKCMEIGCCGGRCPTPPHPSITCKSSQHSRSCHMQVTKVFHVVEARDGLLLLVPLALQALAPPTLWTTSTRC